MKKNTTSQVFKNEFQLLEEIKKIGENKAISKDDLQNEYQRLTQEYDKLLKQSVKMTRIGDASQMKLMRSWELEQEKQQLSQIIKDWAIEIEKKNQQLESQTNLLKEKSEKLKEMAELKSRFFANISHEFRTPLTLIIGPLEQLLTANQGTNNEKPLTLSLRNAQRLLGLINQLLELAKFESGKLKLQVCLQNIIPFIQGITASFELLALQNELDLTFESHEEDVTLFYDPEKLEEIFYNILLNAIKFTPPGGRVSVKIRKNSDTDSQFPYGTVDISVSDTGQGIPADRLGHIFDRYYQLKDYESKHKGSGIGLAIAKEMTELHNGKIEVSSRQGSSSGTQFTIRLPLGDVHLNPEDIIDISQKPYILKSHAEIRELYMAEKHEKESVYGDGKPELAGNINEVEKTGAGTRQKNVVLIVEDSLEVRNYVKGTLEPQYKVLEAVNGHQGIEISKQTIPDIIISDVMMPEIDGFELCQTLKKNINTSHIPIILLSAKASQDSVLEGLEAGADDYITKPFNTRILRVRIKNLIDLRRQQQQTINREMTLQPVEISISDIDKEFLDEVQQTINKNISDTDFNVDLLCKKMYMSRATIYRKILALTGESPAEFIRSCRLKKGAHLLKKNFGTVLEVALEVGFSSSSYFTKCFKDKFHQLPSAYQYSSKNQPPEEI